MESLVEARAAIYTVLGSLYRNEGVENDYELILTVLSVVNESPFAEGIEEYTNRMLHALRENKDEVAREAHVLFNLPFGDFINSSMSYYHDERELGMPTINTKEIMCEAGYIKADFVSVGEDEAGILFGLSARLLHDGHTELQKKLFYEVVEPYIKGFIDAQFNSGRADFYKDCASFLALFIAFEKSYFEFYLS
ncbi:MAG: hypothetical protein Q8R58_04415 [Sulfuricurvum sp.]|nr:hypothetical protein [Sulfuricurvum sp.]